MTNCHRIQFKTRSSSLYKECHLVDCADRKNQVQKYISLPSIYKTITTNLIENQKKMSASLVDIRAWMTRYPMSVFLALGVLGNVINVYMFSRRDFRRSACSLYLLAASCANFISVAWGISPALYTLTNPDPSTYSFIYCKLRLYTIHTSLMLGRSFIVLACAERYALCSQSVRLRVLCQPKMAIRIIFLNFLVIGRYSPYIFLFSRTSMEVDVL